MASFVIEGGHRLQGEIVPQGAKNEVLQVVCATLLTSEEVTIENIPESDSAFAGYGSQSFPYGSRHLYLPCR